MDDCREFTQGADDFEQRVELGAANLLDPFYGAIFVEKPMNDIVWLLRDERIRISCIDNLSILRVNGI